MVPESGLDLSTFTAQQYTLGQERVRAAYVAAILKRFGVFLERPESEWIDRSISGPDNQKLSSFFKTNSDFGPQTNLAQLLQMMCSHQAIINYKRARMPEYRACQSDVASIFDGVSDNLARIIFANDALTKKNEINDIYFNQRGLPRPIRLTYNDTRQYQPRIDFIENTKTVYPNSLRG